MTCSITISLRHPGKDVKDGQELIRPKERERGHSWRREQQEQRPHQKEEGCILGPVKSSEAEVERAGGCGEKPAPGGPCRPL